MGKIDSSFVKDAEQYILDLFKKELPDGLYYHTADHTRFVVNAVDRIGKASGLDEHALNVARVAGWFHDAGYVRSTDDHETESRKMATEFLRLKGVDESQMKS